MSATVSALPSSPPNSHEIAAFSYTPPLDRNWYERWPVHPSISKEQKEAILALLQKAEITIPEDVAANIREDKRSELVTSFIKAANPQIVEKVILPKLLNSGSIKEIIRYHAQTKRTSDKWILVPEEGFNSAKILNDINAEAASSSYNSLYTRVHPARIILPEGVEMVKPGLYTSLNLKGSHRTKGRFFADDIEAFNNALETLRTARNTIRKDEFIITPSNSSNSIQLSSSHGASDSSFITERERLTQLFLEKAIAAGIDTKKGYTLPSFGPTYKVSLLRPS